MSIIDNLVTAIEFDGVKIAVPRATSLFLTLKLEDNNGDPYVLKDGEKAIFGVKKHSNENEPYMIKKVIDSTTEIEGVYPFILTADDTNISEGRYFYDLGVELEDGSFQKSIKAEVFFINKSITRKD